MPTSQPLRSLASDLPFQNAEVEGAEHTLRITFQETEKAAELKLEGRLAGPWADELDRVWVEMAPQLASKQLTIDLRNVIYADARGREVLRAIFSQTNATFLTSTPWTQFLATQVAAITAEATQ